MTGWHKTVRAVVAALITTLLALLMHAAAGGMFSLMGTVVVFTLVLWASMILTGRRLGHVGIGAILSLGQVLMHVSMDWFSPRGADPATSIIALLGPHTHSVSAVPGGHEEAHASAMEFGAMTGMSHSMADGSTASTAMLVSHAVAVLITTMLLKRGEDLVLSILQLAMGPMAVAVVAKRGASGALIDEPVRLVLLSWHLPRAISSAVTGPNFRRGPPALV